MTASAARTLAARIHLAADHLDGLALPDEAE
jgi:hypothetical protein